MHEPTLTKPAQENQKEKTKFLLRNLFRGFVWLSVIVGGYVFARKYLNFDIAEVMGPFYEMPTLIFSSFFVSEVVFGIIPPEFFMIWSARHGDISLYLQNIVAFSAMSYAAGVIGFFIGTYFNGTQLYALIKKNFLGKMEYQFNRFGGFLVIVAALTPLPFSGICMLTGAVRYPQRKFFIIALTRFIRFSVYASIIWESNIL